MSIFNNLRSALGLRKLLLTSTIANKLNVAPPVVVEEQWTIEPPNPLSHEEAEAFIKAQPFWYQRIYLGNGIYTMPLTFPDRVWALIKPTFPTDLKGASILDVGCNAGFSRSSRNCGVRAVFLESNRSTSSLSKPSTFVRFGRWISNTA